jgi:hypothetical protein
MAIEFDAYYPSTLEDAVNTLERSLTKEEHAMLLKIPEWAGRSHFGFGMAMRNGWNLWGVQPDVPKVLHDNLKNRFGLGHADDMSDMILQMFEARMKGDYFSPEDFAHLRRKWWKDQNMDPLTALPMEAGAVSSVLSIKRVALFVAALLSFLRLSRFWPGRKSSLSE